MSVLSLTCPTVGCYQNYNCDPEFQNKIIAVAYVKKSAALTPLQKSNAQDWMDALMQAYLDGDAYLVFNTSGDKPKPDTATTTGRGMQNTKTLAKTHTLNYMDMQGITLVNVEFYNTFLSTSQLYDFYYFTPNRIWDASGSYVTVIGDPVITAELNTYQMAEVVVTWISKVNPLPYNFNTDTFLEGLYFNIEGPSSAVPTTSFTNVCSTTATEVTGWTAVLNYQDSNLIEGTLVWSLQAGDDEVPTGLGIDANGDLTLDTVDTGTYNLNVVVSNEAGCVFGTLEFTIEVVDCGG
jgi:hypothetical protein